MNMYRILINVGYADHKIYNKTQIDNITCDIFIDKVVEEFKLDKNDI